MSKERGKTSIESQGRRWAERRKEDMVEGLDRSVLLIRDTERYHRIEKLPSFLDKRRSPYLKYDEAGNIYVSRWNSMRTEFNEENKRRLINPRGLEYRVLHPKRHRADYVNNLPLEVPVAEIIWAKVEGIEKAIRKQQHIIDAFDPARAESEAKIAQRVIEYVDELSTIFITKKVTEGNLEELATQTEEFLVENNLVDPEDKDKRHTRDMLLSVPRTDGMGRVNKLVSRVRLRAAYLAATRRLVMGSFVAEKFGTNLEILSYEREITRWALRSSVRQLSLYVLPHGYLKRGAYDSELQKRMLKQVIETLADGHLSTPRVKPYLGVSRYAQISLVGANMSEGRMLDDRSIFGDEVAMRLYRQIPVTTLIDTGDYQKARTRVETIVSGIDNVLWENEDIER